MIITTLAMATILIGKPNQLQPLQSQQSSYTVSEVEMSQETIINIPTTSPITNENIEQASNIVMDYVEVEVKCNNEDSNNGWRPIEWDAIEIIEEDETIEEIPQYMVY